MDREQQNTVSSSDPPGNSPEPCDAENEKLNDSSTTEGEKEKVGMPADMKHEKQTSPGESSDEGFEWIGDEETEAGREGTKDSESPGQSALIPSPVISIWLIVRLTPSGWTSVELDIFKGEWWPKVKVFPFITGETFGAYEAIMEKVKNNENYWLNYWLSYLSNYLPIPSLAPTFEEKQSPEESSVIIVFCPITSRVGSDVESAMTNPKVSLLDKPVILVLMHHTRDPDYSTAGTKWSEVYDNVKLDVHVLFHETLPGLLNCQQNNQAIEAIEKKLYYYIFWPFVSSYLSKSSHTPSQNVYCRKETNV